MPFRMVRGQSDTRRHADHYQPQNQHQHQQSPIHCIPRQSPRKSATDNGNDTSGTYSPDSSFEHYHDGRPPRGKPKVSVEARANNYNDRLQKPQRVMRSSKELDDIFLLDTLALAKKEKEKQQHKNNRHQHHQSSSSNSSRKSNGLYMHVKELSDKQSTNSPTANSGLWKTQDTENDSLALASLVSNMTLGSSGALTCSAVGLSLLSASPPRGEWTNSPSIMVRESLARHIQNCITQEDSSSGGRGKGDQGSLPVDVDDVSFVKTNPEQVGQVALHFVAEGEYDKALEIYRALLRSQLKQQHRRRVDEFEIANTKSKLAALCLLMGRIEAALKCTNDVLKTHQKSSQQPVHMTLSTIELGLAQIGAGQLDRALKSWREALQLACMTLGYDHFQVAVLLNNIGCLHYYMGNLSSSVRALEESLGLQRQMLSSTSPAASVEIPLIQIATTMGNLSLISAECKSYDVAVNLLEEATAIQESVLNETDNTDNNVAQTYLERLNKLLAQESENQRDETSNVGNAQKSGGSATNSSSTNSLLQPTVSIFGDSDGIPLRRGGTGQHNQSGCEDHSFDFILLGSLVKPVSPRQRVHYTIISSLEYVVQNQNAQEMLDDASVTSSLFVRKKRSIPVDLDGEAVIDAELHLEDINLQALDHLFRNEIKDALDLFECSLRCFREKYGDIHHLVGTGLHNCGIVHMVAQHYPQAKVCFEEAINVRTAALGDSHPDVAASMFKLGMIHMTNGDFDNALTIFKRIISQLQKNRATSGYAAEAKMLNNIGVLLYEMGKDGDADASLLKAFDIQKSIFKQSQCPSAERVAANILGNLGFIYAKQGKYSDALQVFTETLEVLKKYVPLDHPLIVTVEENVAMVKAYGAEEPEDRRRHAQSNPFACVQTDFVKPKQQPLAQSKVTACVGLQ